MDDLFSSQIDAVCLNASPNVLIVAVMFPSDIPWGGWIRYIPDLAFSTAYASLDSYLLLCLRFSICHSSRVGRLHRMKQMIAVAKDPLLEGVFAEHADLQQMLLWVCSGRYLGYSTVAI